MCTAERQLRLCRICQIAFNGISRLPEKNIWPWIKHFGKIKPHLHKTLAPKRWRSDFFLSHTKWHPFLFCSLLEGPSWKWRIGWLNPLSSGCCVGGQGLIHGQSSEMHPTSSRDLGRRRRKSRKEVIPSILCEKNALLVLSAWSDKLSFRAAGQKKIVQVARNYFQLMPETISNWFVKFFAEK